MDSIKALPCFAKQWHQKEFVLRKGQKNWYTSDPPLLAVKYHATDKP